MKTDIKPENRNWPREHPKNTKKGGLNRGIREIRENTTTRLLLFRVFSVFRGYSPQPGGYGWAGGVLLWQFDFGVRVKLFAFALLLTAGSALADVHYVDV